MRETVNVLVLGALLGSILTMAAVCSILMFNPPSVPVDRNQMVIGLVVGNVGMSCIYYWRLELQKRAWAQNIIAWMARAPPVDNKV